MRSKKGPTPVTDEQVNNFRLLEKHVGEFFYGSEFEAGDLVCGSEGAFKGLQGIVRLAGQEITAHPC